MALRIETFNNATGGNTLYKALTHPCAMRSARALVRELADNAPLAIYDPGGAAEAFAELFALDGIEIAGIYVQQIERLGSCVFGRSAQPATELADSRARSVLVAAFDAERQTAQLGPLLPEGARIFSLDAMRIPSDRLTNRRFYLDPLNFATNFAFFRDADGLHTRLATANYWSGYGGGAVTCWLTLFGDDGEVLAEWCERCGPAAGSIVLDSREVRDRFRLPEFCGQLFLHVVGAAGHDIVKYALDTFGEVGDATSGGGDRSLSATHDANAWPADRYAGLPAPAPGEQVVLWVQNSHPVAIPAGAVGLNRMGEERVVPIGEPIEAFASRAVDVADLLPDVAWPAQIELRAGKHMVRPRYEVVERDRRRIAHVNVERGDLRQTRNCRGSQACSAKDICCPHRYCRGRRGGPWCCRRRWRSAKPSCRSPRSSTIPDGNEVLRHRFGSLPRGHATVLDLDGVAGIEASRRRVWPCRAGLRLRRRRARPMAGCMRSFAIAAATAATPPKPALARMCSTRS